MRAAGKSPNNKVVMVRKATPSDTNIYFNFACKLFFRTTQPKRNLSRISASHLFSHGRKRSLMPRHIHTNKRQKEKKSFCFKENTKFVPFCLFSFIFECIFRRLTWNGNGKKIIFFYGKYVCTGNLNVRGKQQFFLQRR